MQRDIRKLLCQLTRWVKPGVWLFLFIGISLGLINYRDESTTAELNELLYSRIMDHLKSNHLIQIWYVDIREGEILLVMLCFQASLV